MIRMYVQALEAVLAAVVEAAESAAAQPTAALALLSLQDVLALLLCLARRDAAGAQADGAAAAVALRSCAGALPAICRAGIAIAEALAERDVKESLQIRCAAANL